VFEIHLHLVWVTRYRKPALIGAVGLRLRELARELCGEQDVHILKGHVSRDHVPLLVSVSRLVERLKEKTAYNTLDNFRYVFIKAFEGLFIDRMEQNEELFAKYMNNPNLQKLASEHLLKRVYEEISQDGTP